MKTLILTVSAGGGHIHAANAVKDYILINSPESEIKILDTIKYINPMIDKVVIGSYLKSIKITPSIFGKLYNYSESEIGFTSSVTNKFDELMAYRLLPTLNQYKPDIIVCTNPIPADMISILKERGQLNVPVITILTDYAPHNLWLHPCIDAYVVSNSDMISEMAERGINKNIIYDFGIPVELSFINSYDKSEVFEELELDTSKKTILVMGGSLGMGKISDIYSELLKVNADIQIIVITGNNKKLYSELSKIDVPYDKKTKIIGFTEEVNKYMQVCDLLLTKPGGLTITEALICKIPIAVFSPIPGQEEKNIEFLLKHKLAINLGSPKSCSKKIEEILKSKEILNDIKVNCEKFSKPDSGNNIYKLMQSMLGKCNKDSFNRNI